MVRARPRGGGVRTSGARPSGPAPLRPFADAVKVDGSRPAPVRRSRSAAPRFPVTMSAVSSLALGPGESPGPGVAASPCVPHPAVRLGPARGD